ncbi:MAG TPA: molybdate ABC transporter permease subunit [Microbacteriaceae bacterium]|nr:molybdate ABC transporter permease subunit [Microbacteriaceae bacterium]
MHERVSVIGAVPAPPAGSVRPAPAASRRRRRRTGAGSLGRPPGWLIIPAGLAVAMLALPLVGLVARVEWDTLWQDVTAPATLEALWLSVWTGLVATAVCAVLGIPLGVLIARSSHTVATGLRVVTMVPLLLPPMVGGVALLYLLGRNGWIGQWLAAIDVRIPFTPAAVVLAQVFVALPFLVLAVEGSLRTLSPSLPEAAATLGASNSQILRHVTLPLAAPGVIAGLTLCFARAVGEFGATALFAGNAPGVTRTMPLAIYTAFNGAGVSQGSAIALSLMLLVTAVGVLLLARAWRPAA